MNKAQQNSDKQSEIFQHGHTSLLGEKPLCPKPIQKISQPPPPTKASPYNNNYVPQPVPPPIKHSVPSTVSYPYQSTSVISKPSSQQSTTTPAHYPSSRSASHPYPPSSVVQQQPVINQAT